MTVAVQTPYAQATGNGAATNFPFQFLVLAKTDLSVYVDGVLKVVDVDYTVAGLGVTSGGSITFFVAPANLLKVVQVRTMARSRVVDYQQFGDFQTLIVNPDFDRPILLVQDMGVQLGRAIITPPDEVTTLPTLPSIATRAGKFMGFGPDGLPVALTGTGNDSALRTDLAVTVSGTDGSRLIGFKRTEANTSARSVYTKLEEVRTPKDFGAVGDAVTDDAAAIQREINSCIAAGVECDLFGTSAIGYKINTPLSITGPLKIRGHGYRCGISTNGCNGFNIAAGVNEVELSGFLIKSGTRYTDSANALVAINLQGVTANRNWIHTYRDLLLDGFLTGIQANSIQDGVIDNVRTVFGKNGILADQLSTNTVVANCNFSGEATGTGLRIGDGAAASASEGWTVSDTMFFNFATGIHGLGASNCYVHDCQMDFFQAQGMLLQSGVLAATNWNIADNYMACGSATGIAGIRLLNDVVSSNPRGNRLHHNDIFPYLFGGALLSYGILIDGLQETLNSTTDNIVYANAGGGFDLRMVTGTRSRLRGNTWRNLGASIGAGLYPVYNDNTGPASGVIDSVASAAALTLPPGPRAYIITGVTNITSIVATGHEGDLITLIFAGILTVTDGGNLKLAGNFVTTGDDTLTLFCAGGNWYEAGGRAVI